MKQLHLFVTGMVLVLSLGIVISPPVFASSPIKVGLLVPLSGTYAREGEFIRNGVILAFAQAGKIDGREVQVIVEDTEMKPEVGTTKARKLVERDKVNFTAGCYSSAVGLAVRDYADRYQVPHIYVAGSTAIEFITTKKSDWTRHGVYGGPSHGFGLPEFVVKDLGLKTVISMAPDYAWGWSEAKFIKAGVENAGGQVVQSMLTPFPTLDYSPYLAKLADAKVIYAEYAGADAPRLIKQYRNLGIKMPLLGSAPLMPGMLEDAGLAAVGLYTAMVWYPVLKNPENLKFMEGYQKKFGTAPGLNAATAYSATLGCIHALQKIGGKVENKRAFLDAWYTIKDLKTPLGNYSFEKSTHSPIQPVYIAKVIEEQGKPTYQIVKETPDARASAMLKMMGLFKE